MRYLRPTAEIAQRALLPGDPGVALAMAQALLEPPKMSNHHHGLWGYSGESVHGGLLTIQSTGIGGPSGVSVLEELLELGVRDVVRVGTCRCRDGNQPLGSLIVVERALAQDGTSRALKAGAEVEPDAALLRELRIGLARARVEPVLTVDLHSPAPFDGEVPAGLVEEVVTAPLLAMAAQRGARAAAVLVVAEDDGGKVLSDDELDPALLQAGQAAARALADVPAAA